ncbi:MAG: branched-chain amino acid ABC transporter permease, partial [Dehalococcoidia bacterium]|nr:branched-chain amino acid ABC transporter permease [Dehalococcoidia bacterium]
MVIIGGIGTTLGAILGVIFMRLLEQGLLMLAPLLSAAFPLMETAFASALCPLVFGIVIIVFLIAEPRGLAHRWMLLKSAYRLWPFSY